MHKSRIPGIIFPLLLSLCVPAVLFAGGSGNVKLIARLDIHNAYNDCWGYTAPDGREYALLGTRDGTAIIDLASNPPKEIAFIPSSFSIWKDIKTYRHYAYVVTEANNRMQIIDLSALPGSAVVVATYQGFETSPHNIYIDEDAGMLYGAEDNNRGKAVRAISLSDPLNPREVAAFGPDCHDMFAQNGILYVAEGWQPSIGIFDVRDPANPSLLTRLPIPASGYVHNVWASEDNAYIMTTEETYGKTVKIWDVRNLENIVLLDEYLAAGGLAHNVFIKGNYAYLSHYSDGLRIVNISEPENIFEEGFYDTADAWGAYPYFASGKVLISDISEGLYVVFFEGAADSLVVIPDDSPLPATYQVSQNYPNPFNSSTTIDFSVTETSHVTLVTYTINGQKVKTLADGWYPPGSYEVNWDGLNEQRSPVSSGIYLYRFQADRFVEVRRMVLLK